MLLNNYGGFCFMKKFSEIEYKRPDFEALRNSYATLMERFKKVKDV